MGNEGSKATKGGTTVDIVLDRKVSQAGSALKGTLKIKIGSDGSKLVNEYTSGIVVEAQLFGAEKAYWALNMKHQPGNAGKKNLVPGPNRREQATILCDIKQQLTQLNPMQMSQHNVKIE